jgi:hypothetical protein
MAVGLELSNTSGKCLLSSRWHLLKFAGKGTTVSRVSYTRFGTYIGIESIVESPVIPGGAYPSLFFYIPAGTNVTLCCVASAGGGKWRATFMSPHNMFPEAYWFYETVKPASGQTYGMQLYSEAGELIFDTGWNASDLLKLSAMLQVVASIGNNITVPANITKPALMFHSCYWHHYTSFIREWFYLMGINRTLATNFALVDVPVHYNQVSYDLGFNHFYSYDGRTINVPVIDGSKYD